jgi:nicotinamide mononucleotide transporter
MLMIEWILNNSVELVAALLGVTGVWLTTRQNIWCWPVGLLNVTLSMFVFFNARLYYDFILQIFYFVLTLYGWYHWLFGKMDAPRLPVKSVSKQSIFMALGITAVSVLLLGRIAELYTDASLPYWDALTTAGGIIATFWMAKKIIENWLAWIVIDLICTVIYIYKELYAFSVLYFIFAVLAVIGYIQWKKDLECNSRS